MSSLKKLTFADSSRDELLVALRVRVTEWFSHSAVVQEVPGSNPADAKSVGQ